MNSNKNLIFLGMMGSGKSSIGNLVSKKLNLQFVDIDNLIIETARMTISEILISAFFTIKMSISINGRSNFLEINLPIEDLPDPIMPKKTRFFFKFINFLY